MPWHASQTGILSIHSVVPKTLRALFYATWAQPLKKTRFAYYVWLALLPVSRISASPQIRLVCVVAWWRRAKQVLWYLSVFGKNYRAG